MADFAPPAGPPPPKVPEGWKAVWNEQYREWFFVNIYTKQSQWDKPTEPIYPPGGSNMASADAPPPGYDHSTAQAVGAEKKSGVVTSGNSFNEAGPAAAGTAYAQLSDDEKLARKLQEEENQRLGGTSSTGEAGGYYSQPGQNAPGYVPQGQLPPRPDADRSSKGKSILGKLFGKQGKQSQQQYAPQQGGQGYYSQPGYPPQGYPPQGYPPQAGYYPPGRPGRRPGGGMGMGGAAALGVGGGLVGGMLLGEALDGGDHGGDYGGDDGGGGDFGGGGGDFGGGDFGGGDF